MVLLVAVVASPPPVAVISDGDSGSGSGSGSSSSSSSSSTSPGRKFWHTEDFLVAYSTAQKRSGHKCHFTWPAWRSS